MFIGSIFLGSGILVCTTITPTRGRGTPHCDELQKNHNVGFYVSDFLRLLTVPTLVLEMRLHTISRLRWMLNYIDICVIVMLASLAICTRSLNPGLSFCTKNLFRMKVCPSACCVLNSGALCTRSGSLMDGTNGPSASYRHIAKLHVIVH